MKRIVFAMCLAAILLTAGFAASAKVSPQTFMDILRYVSGDVNVSTSFIALDVNGDGSVTSADLNVAAIDLKKQVENDGYTVIVQRVVATPSYSFGNNSFVEDDGFICLTMDEVVDYDSTIPSLGYISFAVLGLEGEADDYFLCDIEIKLEEPEAGSYKVASAKSLGTKVTVPFDEVEFGTVSGEAKEYYYDPEAGKHKFINGKLTLGDYVTYLFDAPYSFTQSSYNYKYNASFITLDEYEGDIDTKSGAERVFRYVYDDSINYTLRHGTAEEKLSIVGTCHEDINSDNEIEYTWNNAYLSQLYHGGLGEIDVYDCDSNGKPEYLFVKNYVAGTIDTEEEMSLYDGFDIYLDAEENIIFTDMAIVDGEAGDKDIVLAYVNSKANYVKIAEVLEEYHRSSFETVLENCFTLTTGEKVYFENPTSVVANGKACLEYIYAMADANAFDEEFIVYFNVDGRLVYAKDAAAGFDVTKDYYIVLAESTISATASVDGRLELADYIEVWNGKDIVFVKAKKVYEFSNVFDDITTPETYDIYTNSYDFSAYVNKPAIGKTDNEGAYYFKLVDFTSFNDRDALKDTYDENAEYRAQVSNIEFSHYQDKIFNLGDERVYIRDYTQIIIKSWDRDTDEAIIKAYSLDNLPNLSSGTKLENVSYVIFNNINSSINENLAYFYGEYDGEIESEPIEANEVRIITGGTYNQSTGKCEYSAFNPHTGKMEQGLLANEDIYEFETGTVFAYGTDGVIDTEYELGNIYYYGDPLDLDDVRGSIEFGFVGFDDLVEYDPASGFLLLNYNDCIYVIDDNTVVSFSNAQEGTFEQVDKDIFYSTDSIYRQNGDIDNDLRVFLGTEKSTGSDFDDIRNVKFAIVVRQNPEYIEIPETEISVDIGTGVVLGNTTYTFTEFVDGKNQAADYIDIWNGEKVVSVKAKKVDEYSSVYDVNLTPETYDRYTNRYDFSNYVNRLCDVKCDKDGLYYFRLWNFNEHNDENVLIGDEEGAQYRSIDYDCTFADMIPDTAENISFPENAELIIRAVDRDGNDAVYKLSAEEFLNIPQNVYYYDASIVIENDASSENQERIVAFYGVTDRCLFDTDEPVITSLGTCVVLSDTVLRFTMFENGKLTTNNCLEIFDGERIIAVKVRKIVEGSEFQDDDTPSNYYRNYDEFDFSNYVNKLCEINCDDRGYYHFDLLDFISYNDEDVLNSDDENAEYRVQGDNIIFDYYTNNIFNLDGKKVYIRDYTKIFIKHMDEKGEWTVSLFDANNLPNFKDGTKFVNVSYIIKNNPVSRTFENLAYFYGIIDDELEFDLSAENNARVVLSYSKYVTAQDGMTYRYELMNPYTGKIETEVKTSDIPDKQFNRGEIVTVNKNGEIDDELGAFGNVYYLGDFLDSSKDIYRYDSLGYVYVEEFDEETGYLVLASTESFAVTETGREEYVLSDYIDADFVLNDDTVVTFSDKSSGNLKLVDKATLAATSKIYRQDEDKNRHLRVFISATPSSSNANMYTVDFAMIARD